MIPLNRALRQAFDAAYDDARRQWEPCANATAAGLAAARRLYVGRTGLDDALTDACVEAMIWPRHPGGAWDPQRHEYNDRRPEYGEQADDGGAGMTAWAIRFFARPDATSVRS
jgi:hypothetical protein